MVRKQNVCDVLRVSVPFVQLKKREKHPWRSVTFKPATLLKVTLFHGCLSRFLIWANSTNRAKHHRFLTGF